MSYKKNMLSVVGLGVAVLLGGCATLENTLVPPKRKVVDNSFFSSKYPNGVVNVDDSLTYAGMVPDSQWRKYASNTGGTYHHKNSYLFVSKDKDNIIDKSLIINTWTLGSGYWIPGFEKDGFVEVDKYIRGNQRFDTGVFHQAVSRDNAIGNYLEDSNYLLPSCMMFKTYQKVYSSGKNAKNKMTISYGEPILCEKTIMFLPENQHTERTQAFLEKFNKKADASFQSVSFN